MSSRFGIPVRGRESSGQPPEGPLDRSINRRVGDTLVSDDAIGNRGAPSQGLRPLGKFPGFSGQLPGRIRYHRLAAFLVLLPAAQPSHIVRKTGTGLLGDRIWSISQGALRDTISVVRALGGVDALPAGYATRLACRSTEAKSRCRYRSNIETGLGETSRGYSADPERCTQRHGMLLCNPASILFGSARSGEYFCQLIEKLFYLVCTFWNIPRMCLYRTGYIARR